MTWPPSSNWPMTLVEPRPKFQESTLQHVAGDCRRGSEMLQVPSGEQSEFPGLGESEPLATASFPFWVDDDKA